MKRSGDGRRFEVLGPLLSIEGDERPRAELARELGLEPVALRVALMRFRRRYQEPLVKVVSDSVGSTDEAGRELRPSRAPSLAIHGILGNGWTESP